MIRDRVIDISIAEVSEAYSGTVGALWEMLMGEQIHVNGPRDTDILAGMAAIRPPDRVLDICSALGGPARQLAARYGCRVVGVDATPAMVEEARKRTEEAGLGDRVTFRLGNALDLPFRSETFDVVWGQDAWCYVTDKERLIREAARVTRRGGTLAFTDWIQSCDLAGEEQRRLLSFMIFPNLQTLEGYTSILGDRGWEVQNVEDLSRDFALHCAGYLERVREELRPLITSRFGPGLFTEVEQGIALWEHAARLGRVGRGRWIARRTGP